MRRNGQQKDLIMDLNEKDQEKRIRKDRKLIDRKVANQIEKEKRENQRQRAVIAAQKIEDGKRQNYYNTVMKALLMKNDLEGLS